VNRGNQEEATGDRARENKRKGEEKIE